MAWDVNDSRNDLVRLKQLFNKEKDIEKKNELNTYIYVLEETIAYYSFTNKARVVGQSNFNRTLFSLPKYRMYLPHIKEFISILDNYKIDVGEEHKISKDDYTEKDMYNLTTGFYKQIGGKTFEKYQEIDYEKAGRINFTNESSDFSRTYVIPVLDKFYINLGAKSDERDIIEAYIHEIGHIITFKQNNKRYHSRDMFVEIESLFYEILGDDYLSTKTGDIYFKDLEKERVDSYYNKGNIIDIMNIAYNTVMDNSLHLKKPDKAFNTLCRAEGLVKPGKVDIDTTMKYLFSFICAVELVEIYKEDKEKALYLLNNIISENKNIEEYEKIIKNVNPCEHLEGYVKSLKKEK